MTIICFLDPLITLWVTQTNGCQGFPSISRGTERHHFLMVATCRLGMSHSLFLQFTQFGCWEWLNSWTGDYCRNRWRVNNYWFDSLSLFRKRIDFHIHLKDSSLKNLLRLSYQFLMIIRKRSYSSSWKNTKKYCIFSWMTVRLNENEGEDHNEQTAGVDTTNHKPMRRCAIIRTITIRFRSTINPAFA